MSRYRVKYFTCGFTPPAPLHDTSTWPVYSSDNVPDGAALQTQLASFDPRVRPLSPMYLWDASACRLVPFKPNDTLPPGDSAVLVYFNPGFLFTTPSVQVIASKLDNKPGSELDSKPDSKPGSELDSEPDRKLGSELGSEPDSKPDSMGHKIDNKLDSMVHKMDSVDHKIDNKLEGVARWGCSSQGHHSKADGLRRRITTKAPQV